MNKDFMSFVKNEKIRKDITRYISDAQQRRKAQRYNQIQWAEKKDLDINMVRKIEQGKCNSLKAIAKYCAILVLFASCTKAPCKYKQRYHEIVNLVNFQDSLIAQRDSIIKENYNSVLRLQIIAGVKNPDSEFTYVEKLQNHINTRNLTKANNYE